MGNLAKMRNAFNLGRLLESKLEYLTVTEGEMKPKYVDPEVLLGLAGDFGLADKVKEILDKSRSAPNPELYNSARALLGNFMAMHNPEQVTAAASAGFVLNSLLVPEDSIVVATGFDLGPLRSRVGEVLRASFASPRLVENVQAQITALDSSQGDLARHSAFASLLICVFEHLDTDDCTAAKKISECMSSCNVRSDKFLEESNNLLEYYRDYHLAKSEGRRGAVLGGGRNAQS